MEKIQLQIKQLIGSRDTVRDNGIGLLSRFTTEKAEGYVEPTREGTARGNPIGFPREKHLAVLSRALIEPNLKGLAEKLNISYGVLRNWSTEREFKRLMQQYREEFIEVFLTHFWNHYKKVRERGDDQYEMGVQIHGHSRKSWITWDPRQPESEEQRQKELEEFGLQDYQLYGHDLLRGISRRIETAISRGEVPTTYFWLHIMNLLLSSPNRRFGKLGRLNDWILRQLEWRYAISQLEQTKSILQSPETATPKSRQLAIRLLEQVQGFLTGAVGNEQ